MTGHGLFVLAALPASLAFVGGVPIAASSSTADLAFAYQSGAASHPDAPSGPSLSPASYKLSGERSLRPARIGDDGIHMYIEWSEEQALPAVFALNALGEEEMVDGYMRQGVFTIDRVHDRLVFRIGKKHAKAVRVSR